MSDDFDFADDGEEYDFEYEEEDEEHADADIDLENRYYAAKGLKEDDKKAALSAFEDIIKAQQEEPCEWGFKALKQSVKLAMALKRHDEALEAYKQLLAYTSSVVTRNYAEKSVNSMLNVFSANSTTSSGFMQQCYDVTLRSLTEQRNDRLWMKTNLKLAKLWLDSKDYVRLRRIIKQLHDATNKCSGSLVSSSGEAIDDQSKGAHMLEILALEIQLYTETKNNQKLRSLYHRTLNVKSAVPHPRIMGVIRECGGKMHLNQKQYENAQLDFFEAFKNYDEAGDPQRISCLKYLVLTNMLMASQIDPFESQETKPLKGNSQIIPLTNLVSAFQNKDLKSFELILQKNRADILEDTFIRSHIEEVVRVMRCEVLLEHIRPYTRMSIAKAARKLLISEDETRDLFVTLIMDERLKGFIDQTSDIVSLAKVEGDPDIARHESLYKWANGISRIAHSITV